MKSEPHYELAVSRRLLPLLALLLAVALVGTAGVLVLNAAKMDGSARRDSLFFAGKALETLEEGLRDSIKDYALWGAAYVHLHQQLDVDWAYHSQNLGPSLYPDFGYEAIFLINATDTTVYTVVEGKLEAISAGEWLSGGLGALTARARALQGEGVTGFLRHGNEVVAVAAAALTPGGDPTVTPGPSPSSVLLFVDILDHQRLAEVAADYALINLRLSAQPVGSTGIRAITLEDGSPHYLTWDPPEPGFQLLKFTLPTLVAVVAGLALLAWNILCQAAKAGRLMDESYAHLASSRAALLTSEARFRDVAEAASDWIWETDAEMRLTYLSGRFEAITGYSPDEWLGRPISDMLICTQGVFVAGTTPPLMTPIQCLYLSRAGQRRHCRIAAKSISREDVLTGYRGTAADITDEAEAHARVQHLSLHDVLTGLPNRHRMNEYLDRRLIADAGEAPRLAMLCIDLDRFKAVNDTLGHAAGDLLLIEVAARLRQLVDGSDLVARLGGDEFVIVLASRLDPVAIGLFCEQVLQSLSEPFRHEESDLFIGASIGVALAPLHATRAEDLLRCADIALYQAKADGKSVWRLFAPEMNRRLLERRALERDLRAGLAGGEFELYYQPRFHLSDRSIIGAEALLRWHHPERGFISPGDFIGVAEETGLIVPIGSWALRQACLEAVRWPQDIVLSVNLSAVQFRKPGLCELVEAALRESGLPPSRLQLEVTETLLLDQSAEVGAILVQLKSLGLHLAMDDFGTGYASLGYLRTYPFDTIKIDQSFVSAIQHSAENRAIVTAIIGLGAALSMHVTAEGIEDETQLRFLRQEGCLEGQGFLLSRPLNASALRQFLHTDAATSSLTAPGQRGLSAL